jgi:carbamate kinase
VVIVLSYDADPSEAGVRAAKMIAEMIAGHEVVIAHDFPPGPGLGLGLALRNALPDRDVVTVLTQVVVSPGSEPASQVDAQAIVELRSLRTLVDSGAVVICAVGEGAAVAVDVDGSMRPVEVRTDRDQTASLLARRLDADLLLMLTDAEPAATAPKADAVLRFVDATGRRAAIGALTDAAWTAPAASHLASAASAAAHPPPKR